MDCTSIESCQAVLAKFLDDGIIAATLRTLAMTNLHPDTIHNRERTSASHLRCSRKLDTVSSRPRVTLNGLQTGLLGRPL